MGRVASSPWTRELNDFVRALSGAFIFGVPLLLTMEMWWIGEFGNHSKLVVFLALGLTCNVALNFAVGFKRESSLGSATTQAIETMAVGVVAAPVTLVILNRIRPGDPIESVLGMIVIQAVPLSIGASVANEVFGRRNERQPEGEIEGASLKPWQHLFTDVGATAIGGIFVGFSIAPTDEVPMVASGLNHIHLVVLVCFSLLLSYGIVFESGFYGKQPEGMFHHPITETTLSYVVSICVAGIALYLFNQVEIDDPLQHSIEHILVLALPTTIGGAAGRLVI